MSDFKSCAYCGIANGLKCPQCYNMEYYVCDEDKALEYEDFEDEVRKDERTKVINECIETLKIWVVDKSDLFLSMFDTLEQLKEKK